MQQPLVSIIIPVYNSQQFIGPAVLALQEQTYPNLEIIIVDDGSSDGSLEEALHFESFTCKVIKQVNSGAAVARNTGLKHASGDFIQFLDVDDLLSDDKIEKQVKALEEHKNAVAVCNYINFSNESELIDGGKKEDQFAFIYSSDSPVDFLINLYGGMNGRSHFIQTNSWLVPRSVIDKAGEWRSYRCPDDDGEFFARVLLASEGIIYVPGVYNYYRRTNSEANLSQKSGKKYLQNTLLTIDLKHSYLNSHSNNRSAISKAIATQYLNFAVSVYPENKVLSKIAYKRYKSFNVKVLLPKLGGTFIELIKNILGWKTARLLKYYLREKLL